MYIDNPRDPKIVAVVGRWSFLRGHLCYKSSKWDHKMVVVIDRWSLFGGGRYSEVVVSLGLTVQFVEPYNVAYYLNGPYCSLDCCGSQVSLAEAEICSK